MCTTEGQNYLKRGAGSQKARKELKGVKKLVPQYKRANESIGVPKKKKKIQRFIFSFQWYQLVQCI